MSSCDAPSALATIMMPIEHGLPAEAFLETVETRIEGACDALYAEAATKGEGIDWRSREA